MPPSVYRRRGLTIRMITMTKTSSRRGSRRCASDDGRESDSRIPRCASRQRRKIESWRTGHRDSEPPHMDVWADQVARGIGGAGIWNVSTWVGRCVPNVKPVVLALNESTARWWCRCIPQRAWSVDSLLQCCTQYPASDNHHQPDEQHFYEPGRWFAALIAQCRRSEPTLRLPDWGHPTDSAEFRTCGNTYVVLRKGQLN